MDKLIFDEGGMEIEGEDLYFQFNAFKGGIEALLKTFYDSDGNAVLWGCDIENRALTVEATEGYVVLNGELRYMPAQIVSKGLNPFSGFVIVEHDTFHADGNENLIDGGNLDMWQVRSAKIEYNVTPVQPFIRCVDVRSKRIERLVDKVYDDEFTYQNGFTSQLASLVKVQRHGNHVQFTGSITGEVSQGGVQVFRISEDFRPQRAIKFPCISNTANGFLAVSISSSGFVTIDYNAVELTVIVDLSAVSYIV